MYYPKSQIKTNLFTSGDEYVYLGTNNIYSGSYFITGDGKIFTGLNSNNKPNDPLEPSSINLNDFPIDNSELEDFPDSYDIIDDDYYWAKGIDQNQVTPMPKPPIQITPLPSKKEYSIGEIQRYFTSKINEIKYTEVNESQYTSFLNNEPTVLNSLYTTFQLPWVITGNRSKAYNVNMKTVNRIQNNFKLQGFKSYFKGRYDQLFRYTSQDNLYTEGNEFKSIVTGKMFKGYYHIHPNKGPMEGRQHTIKKHNVLLPISGSNYQNIELNKEPISNNYNSSSRAVGYR
jgi:hypothetical protein|tara:strand:+ start:374 stop:1234 length:861 start_codon:yes stop_codon:yes gene_type:complete